MSPLHRAHFAFRATNHLINFLCIQSKYSHSLFFFLHWLRVEQPKVFYMARVQCSKVWLQTSERLETGLDNPTVVRFSNTH